MTAAVQRRRGTAAQTAAFTGAVGEITIDTDNNRIIVHDGATPGGWPASKKSETAAAGANADIHSLSGLTTPLSVSQGGTGGPDAKTARANLGLDKVTLVGNAAYAILATDRTVLLNAALTAPRTWTLPATTGMNPGAALRVTDKAGGISATNTLTLTVSGTDLINGATSVTFSTAYTDFQLVTDGNGNWTFGIQGLERGGTGATTATGARTALGLGSMATQAASAVAITGGTATLSSFSSTSGTVSGTLIATSSVAGNSTKQVALSYDTTNNIGNIQSVNQGVGYTPLALNPSGGAVTVGAGGLSVSGPIKPGGYTVGTLPAAGTARNVVFCSNARMFNGAGTLEASGSGTGGLVSDNGTAWKIAGTNVTVSA